MSSKNAARLPCAWLLVAQFASACFTNASPGRPSDTLLTESTPNKSPLVALTGSPELLQGSPSQSLRKWSLRQLMVIDRRITPTSFYAPFRVPPPNLSAKAKAGNGISLGYRQSSWVLDGDDAAGYVFYLDSAGSGDYSKEAPHSLTRNGAIWETTITARGTTPDGTGTDLVLRIRVEHEQLAVDYVNIRIGHVDVDGRAVKFGVVGVWGYYGLSTSRIAFDVNADGRLDFEEEAYGREWMYNRDRSVNLLGHKFSFSVDRSGSVLTLVPTRHLNRLQNPGIGLETPRFELVTIDGKAISSVDVRGQHVLIDFWSMACPPCVKEIPAISALFQRSKTPLTIIGVTPDDDVSRIRQFVVQHKISWPIVAVSLDRGSIYSTFRVERFPSYVLIDPDGTLLCLDCDLAKVSRLLGI